MAILSGPSALVVIEWPHIDERVPRATCTGTVVVGQPVFEWSWTLRFDEDYSPDEHSVSFADKPKPKGRSLLKPRSAITDILEA